MALRARSGGCVAAGRSVSPSPDRPEEATPAGRPLRSAEGTPRSFRDASPEGSPGPTLLRRPPGAAWLRPARPTETPQPRPSLARRLPGRTLAPDGRLEPAGALPPHPRPSLRRQPRAIMLGAGESTWAITVPAPSRALAARKAGRGNHPPLPEPPSQGHRTRPTTPPSPGGAPVIQLSGLRVSRRPPPPGRIASRTHVRTSGRST